MTLLLLRQVAEDALLVRAMALGAFLGARAAGNIESARQLHADYIRANETAGQAVREYRQAMTVGVEVAA